MLTLKDVSMGIKVVGILYLFYLQYANMVNIPMSVIVLITLGSLGAAMSCKSKMNDGHFHYRYYNYAVVLAGLVVILKEYM
jgi:endoglucanase Acf2